MVWYGTLCVALHMTSELPGVGWNLNREENGKHFVASYVPSVPWVPFYGVYCVDQPLL